MQQPLEGVRVVDMTSVVMGPVATQLLADQGADVVVIEDRRGDTNRAMGPGPHPDLSGVSLNLMRNKRSIGLDVRTEAGYDVLGRLVATADVFVTNLRPGSRRRARLTYADLREFRDDLVYCAAAGYPVDSELADAPAYDDVIQAASGVADLSRRVELPPVLMPTLIADKSAGLVIANNVSAALFARERTGRGADITVAMTEVMRAYLLVEHGAAAVPEPPLGAAGYPRILNAARRPQATADGLISVLPYTRSHYEELFRLGSREDLLDDPRIVSRAARIDNGFSLYQEVAAILRSRTTGEWIELLRSAGIPVAEVATIDSLVDDLPLVDHPHAGAHRVTPPLTGAVAAPDVVRRPAPLHGEHNREVLGELGYDAASIRALESDGVLFGASGRGTTVGRVSEQRIGRPREVVAALPAYRPGKGAEQAEDEHGITDAIKLASNENPDPPLDPVVAAIRQAATGINRYADHRATPLREALADELGLAAAQVTVGAGSAGILQQLALSYIEPGDEVVYPWRSFEVYPVFTQLMNGVSVQVPLAADLGADCDALAAAVTGRTKLVFLATPNNPTGVACTTADLRRLLERVASSVIVCVDEAYREFLDPGFGDPVGELLGEFPNLVVTRTFSKAHGLAGLRVGYAVGHEDVIATVDKTLLPFAVNALAQAAALAALEHDDEIRVQVDAILAERARVEVELAAAGWTFPNHQGNFVWLALGERTDEIGLALERQGVVVRPFSGDGLRVTIGSPAENDRFLSSLAAIAEP